MEKDDGGDGPMHWAAKRGFMKVMCAMKSAGADPKMPGELIVKRIRVWVYNTLDTTRNVY